MRMRPIYLPRFRVYLLVGYRSRQSRLGNEPVVRPRDGKRDAKACAVHAGLYVDASVVRVNHLANDCQPETRALRLGREERVEDAIAQFPRYTRPVICD